MNYQRWLNSKFSVLAYCVASLFLLVACGSADVSTSKSTFSSNNIQYVANVTIDETTTQAGLEAETGGEIILFKPEAGFAVVGFDKPLDSLSTLAGDATENQGVFSQPEFSSQAFDGSGHSSWAGGHSSWAGGHSSWAGGWSSWAGGHSSWAGGETIPALPQDNQTVWDMLNLEEAHMLSQKFGEGSKVAVLDTGIDINHPIFNGRLAPQSEWRDFIDNDNNPSEVSGGKSYGHGTGVSGIILQVAPLATILPIRVLNNDGYGDTDDIILAIEHAINMDVDVINLSLGTNIRVPSLISMINLAQQKGIYVTSASGNGGQRTRILYPADTISSHSLNVGSLDSQGNLSTFTSSSVYMWRYPGEENDPGFQWYSKLGQAAPGENIVSAYPDAQKAAFTGTSFAAPMLAGALALAKSESSSVLTFDTTQGTFVGSNDLEYTKTYRLNVATTIKQQAGWEAPERLNTSGNIQVVQGAWNRSSGKTSTGENNPKYTFSLSQEDLIAVDINASVDAYLYILNSSGQVVAQDDNSGTGTNARIIKSLPKGSYTIVAATSKRNKSASFELVAYGSLSNLK